MLEKISIFVEHYHNKLQDQIELIGRDKYPQHWERTNIIVQCKAKDGFASFYLPVLPSVDIEPGMHIFDLSSYTLNEICQSVTIHRFQIAEVQFGKPWNILPQMIKDTKPIPGFQGLWIQDDVLQAAKSGLLTHFPAITVSPLIKVEKGIQKYIIPSRLRIWSPSSHFSGIGVRRGFLFTHVDLWWFPEKLNLDINNIPTIVLNDLIAFQIIVQPDDILKEEDAKTNSTKHAADLLDNQCDEFLKLLYNFGDKEEHIHQWLKSHKLFLSFNAIEVWSKLAFGAYESDFVIKHSDGTYTLVEIEPANEKIFRSDNSEPTARFNHACQQVNDWKRYIRDNVQTVRNEVGLDGIYEPQGSVIIGRAKDINTREARIRWSDMKKNKDIYPVNYDEIIKKSRSLANNLRTNLISE